MKPAPPLRKEFALLAGAATLLIGFGRPVCADVKIVSTITITGLPTPPQFGKQPDSQASTPSSADNGQSQEPQKSRFPMTITTYYKGKMARTEIENGPVTIYDGNAHKIYLLDPDRKTYSQVSVQQALDQQNALFLAMPSWANANTDLNFQKSDATQTLVGKEASRYDLTAIATLSPPSSPGRHRGFGGGGGFPGSGFPRGGRFFSEIGFQDEGGSLGGNGQSYPGRRQTSSVKIEAEYWLADASLLPAENKDAMLLLLHQTLLPGAPILKPLESQITKLKLMPLSSKVTMHLSMPRAATYDPIVTTLDVQSISTDPIEDVLFKLPEGYTKVALPASHQRQSASR